MDAILKIIAVLHLEPLLGCASAVGQRGPPLGAEPVECGVVTRIEPVSLEGDHQLGLDTVVGAAVGGVIGH